MSARKPELWLLLVTCQLAFACGSESATPPVTPPRNELEERVSRVLEQMTLEEKIEQMHGLQGVPIEGLYHTPDNARLGIPGFRMVDGPRGVRAAGFATTFPVGMARGASWDRDLERRIGEAMGKETAAKGGNVLLAPCINLLWHPAWGRAQETYGEDSHHIGEMGAAFVEGAQRWVLASAKHFAVNSIENTRFTVNVSVGARTLREVYLPHFEKVVREARVGSVMSAYNKVNGAYCAENALLLRDVLKGEWGFDGFVESDWLLGTRSTVESALAGLDIEMPAAIFYGQPLLDAVNAGEVPVAAIDEAVRRILRKKFEFKLDAPAPPPTDVVESAEHTALALEAAKKSTVLLKNEGGVLPLDRASLGSLALVGQLADTANLGDRGSSNSVPSYAITPRAGFQRHSAGAEIAYIPGPELTPEDTLAISSSGAAVVVVGLTGDNEGEGTIAAGDRKSLALPAQDIALIDQVAALNPRTIVVVEGGSAITMQPWIEQVEALLFAWYPGMEGGNAIAEIVFGLENPSAKLPISFPRSADQLQPFVNDSDEVEYGYFHGYHLLDRDGQEPQFPFGFGLSYTTFSYGNLAVATPSVKSDSKVRASVEVSNSGQRAGTEIVQLYFSAPGSNVERPQRQLASFARVSLEPGQTESVTLEFPARDLAYWDEASSRWVVEAIGYTLAAGSSSRDLPATATFEVAR
jgi:beta-glucosidase